MRTRSVPLTWHLSVNVGPGEASRPSIESATDVAPPPSPSPSVAGPALRRSSFSATIAGGGGAAPRMDAREALENVRGRNPSTLPPPSTLPRRSAPKLPSATGVVAGLSAAAATASGGTRSTSMTTGSAAAPVAPSRPPTTSSDDDGASSTVVCARLWSTPPQNKMSV